MHEHRSGLPDAVRGYLITTSVSDDQHILKTNYLKFLGSVFTQVNGELEKCREELSKKQIRTAEDLSKWWSSHLEGLHTELYKVAIDGAGGAIQVRIRKRCQKISLLVIALADSSRNPEEA